jgi:hypothetical protein
MLDFFGSISSFSLARHFEQRQIHVLTDIDGGNDDILIVLHNPLHLDELHLHSRAMCLISSLHNSKNVSLGEFSCLFIVMFKDMAHVGRALAQPWHSPGSSFADHIGPVFRVSTRS